MKAGGLLLALVLLTLICVMVTEAEAVDWIYIGTNSSGHRCFYDADRITRTSSGIVRIWDKFECPERGSCGEIDSGLNMYEVLCERIRERVVFQEYRDKYGNIMNRPDVKREWFDVPLDQPTASAFFEAACRPMSQPDQKVLPMQPPVQQQQQQQQVIIEKSKAQSYLSVTSDPSEAEVYVNDGLIGTTPITSMKLSPGNYRLRVTKGGKTWERNILLPEDASLQIKADLK